MLSRLLSGVQLPFNPMLLHELRSVMRNYRAYVVLTVYMSIVSGIVVFVYIVASAGGNSGINDSSRVGTALFYIIAGMQILLVSFVTPAYTATALSAERERDTYDLLRLTMLSSGQIVISKLVAAVGYTVLLVLASMPMLSLALLLGGVTGGQMLAALAVIAVSALLYATLGLWVSARTASSTTALIVTYAITLGLVIGISILTLITMPLITDALYGTSAIIRTNPILASVLQLMLIVFISASPISAMVATETNYAETGSLMEIYINPLPGTTVPMLVPAPFLVLTAFYLLATTWLIIATIRHLNRMDRLS